MLDTSDRALLALVVAPIATTAAAAVALSQGMLEWGDVIRAYALLGVIPTLGAFWLYAMQYLVRSAITCDAKPIRAITLSLISPRLVAWLAVPTLLAPVFLASFTMLKTLIGVRLGFTWDEYLTNLEAAVLGADAWQYTHAVIGSDSPTTSILQVMYVGLWASLLPLSMSAVPLFASRYFAARFLLAMMLTWIVAGLLVAALIPSAGPCFAYLFDSELGSRYRPLMEHLESHMGRSSTILQIQAHLASTWSGPVIGVGGGISAFPSVHVAVAGLYAAASWRTPLVREAAIAFLIAIWVGSVHFGYHYAIDGIAGIAIAIACWMLAGRLVDIVAATECRRSRRIPG